MARPPDAIERRVDLQPKLPHVAEFKPSQIRDPNLHAFVIPGLFLNAWSETVDRYGQHHADQFGATTYVLSAQPRERVRDPLDQQAESIAAEIKGIVKERNIKRIKLAGDSQGGNIAMSVYRKLVDVPDLTIEELQLRYTRGLTQENVFGLHQLFGLDTLSTIANVARHPFRNRSLFPVIGQYVTDMRRERRKARKDGVLHDLIHASGQLNHDIKFVRPPTKVILEIGENDFLLYFKHLFPHLHPDTIEETLAKDIKARFLPLLDKDDPSNVIVRVIRGANHIGILYPPEPTGPRKRRREVR